MRIFFKNRIQFEQARITKSRQVVLRPAAQKNSDVILAFGYAL
jgi:hypothetical protein